MLSRIEAFLRTLEIRRANRRGRRHVQLSQHRRCLVERLEERTVLSAGVVTTSLSTGPTFVRAGLVVAGDQFVAAGYSNGDSALLRYNSNGTLDTGFGTQGVTITPMVNNNADHFRALAIAPGEKLVAGGIGGAGADSSQVNIALARYSANGVLDTTFGTRGKVQTSFGVTDLLTGVLVLQQDYTPPGGSTTVKAGTIYVGGYNGTVGRPRATILARYTPNGKLDTTFGSGGRAVDKVAAKQAWGLSLSIRNEEPRILQTGYADGLNDDFILVCYKLDGTLDTGFGTNGVVKSNILAPSSQEAQYGNAMAIVPGGGPDGQDRILVGGAVYQTGSHVLLGFRDRVLHFRRGSRHEFRPEDRTKLDRATTGYILTDFGLGDGAVAGASVSSSGLTGAALSNPARSGGVILARRPNMGWRFRRALLG